MSTAVLEKLESHKYDFRLPKTPPVRTHMIVELPLVCRGCVRAPSGSSQEAVRDEQHRRKVLVRFL